MLEKISTKQSFIDYNNEQSFEILEAQNYYALLASHFHCTDCAIYENTIIDIIGQHGFDLVRKYNLIESCGIINYRKLYVL